MLYLQAKQYIYKQTHKEVKRFQVKVSEFKTTEII